MAIENAVYINSLDPEFPKNTDYVSEGAAHIRMIKGAVKATFPNITEPVEINSDAIKIISDKITIDKDSIDFGKLKLKNIGDATADNEVPTKLQVDNILKDMLQNRIYGVGSYYISESELNPGDSSMLGFGVWTKVTGMVMGSGIVNPDGSVPNATRVEFKTGNIGGRVFNTITEDNIPLMTIDGSKFNIVDHEHDHEIRCVPDQMETHNHNMLKDISPGGSQSRRTQKSTNKPRIEGKVSFGKDNTSRQPINTMPPYRVANIWRRES